MATTANLPPKSTAVREERPEGRSKDLVYCLKLYAENNPAAAAMWCFGLGFILGWKLKPW